MQSATNPEDKDSYFPGTNGQKGYNLPHLNALYDLSHHIYTDAVIQKRMDWNEHNALQKMIDRSNIPQALVIADRGYESYNNLAHTQEKGWFFLIRIKDRKTGIKSSLDLPDSDTFDIPVSLKLTRKQTNETKQLFKDKNHYRFIPATATFDYLPIQNRKHEPTKYYDLDFRIIRFSISEDIYETILTNLGALDYPPEKIKQLCASRWDIETSFRDLKYTK